MRRVAHSLTLMLAALALAALGRGDLAARQPAAGPRNTTSSQAQRAQPPAGQSVTRLPDGRWLLVGGIGTESAATLVDPQTRKATVTAGRLQAPRAGHTATVLPNGTVLLLGGRNGDAFIDTPEIFDPSTGTFTLLPIGGASPRAWHSATLLIDGRLLMAGGSHAATIPLPIEIWDLEARTVNAIGSAAIDRSRHRATLMPDGRVAVAGGEQLDGRPVTRDVAIDPKRGAVEPIDLRQQIHSAPSLTASIPADGAIDVALDTRIALQFGEALAPESFTDAITVEGPSGPLATRVIVAEEGRLAFVWPAEPLALGTTYVVTVAGAADSSGNPIVHASMAFTTIEPRPERGTIEPEEWVPDAEAIKNGWRTNRLPSPWESLAPLMAPPGVTAISGRVLTLDGRPLAGVTLAMDGAGSTESDRTGRFLLLAPAVGPGRHVLDIEGDTASRPNRKYGFFEYGATVVAGQTNILPFTIWMPKLDTAHQVRIPSPSTSEVVVTTPYIPGLELHLPPQTVIRDEHGQPVTELGITPIPVDRPPFPLAKNVPVPVYFTIQPGGAYVQTGGMGPKGAWLVYPNYHHDMAGKRVQFHHYAPAGNGWYVYGLGTVSPNAQQVIPDSTTRIYSFTGAMIGSDPSPPPDAPPPGDCDCVDGDPVSLATGLFTFEATDLYLPDVIPIALTRTYRQRDTDVRPFGIGATHPYAMFLWSMTNYQQADVVLPDGARIHYVRTSPGTGFADAIFVHQETQNSSATPTPFYKSVLSWRQAEGDGWNLTLQDGTVYVFGDVAPLQAIRDRYGNTVTITHANGQTGNITQVTSPTGRWIAFTYDTNNRITQARDNIGRTVSYTYDSNGTLATVTDPENHVTSYTYDNDHRMLTVKPPNLQGTPTTLVTTTYDTTGDAQSNPQFGWVTTQTHADGGVYQFAYTFQNGKIFQTLVTDPRGKQRRVTFNTDAYIVADRRGIGSAEEQADSSVRPSRNNFVTSYTSPHGDVTDTAYDALGRVTSVTRLPGTADEATTTYTYDPIWKSEVATITDPLTHTTTFGFDAAGNRTSITDALNHSTSFTYNGAGQVTSVTDPLPHTTTFEYAGPELVTITDPLGRVTQRFSDAAGRMLSHTDPAGQTTRFAYDTVNHLTQITDPLGGTTTYGYDPAGRLQSVTDALTHATTYGYDAFNRLASRTDPLSKVETFAYDLDGNPSEHRDRKQQVTTRTYDALNRLHQITYADTSTITYTYDSGSRLTTIADSLNGTITRTYDNLDRLTSETTAQGTISYTYDKADRRATMTVAGQPTVEYGYDVANRLTSITQGPSVVTITYDDADRRSTLTLPNGIVSTYGYDNGNQLTSLTYTLGPTTLGDLTYTYDVAGRRTSVGGSWARTGLPQALQSATYDGANRLTDWAGQVFSYDPNGNLASDGLTSYTWSARNQLAGLSGATSASFAYDGTGRRRSKTIAGTTTKFLYDGFNFVQEQSTDGTPTANLLTGLGIDETFTRTDASGTNALLIDALGSALALADSSGAVQAQYTFDPFGTTTASGAIGSNTLQFTARENDSTGLYDYRARYYSPALQRFISEDPIGFAGGINKYTYLGNSPLTGTDPLGLIAWHCGVHLGTFGTFPTAAGIKATCTSECVAGRQLTQTLIGGATGAALGYLSASYSYSEFTLHDNFAQPTTFSLPGLWMYSGGGLAGGVLGGAYSSLTLGGASSGPWSLDWEAGFDAGLDAFSGVTIPLGSQWSACKCK